MAISLTSAGLNLEPRVYFNGGSGDVYGVPRFIDFRNYSFSGSWSGFRIYIRAYNNIYEVKSETFNSVSTVPQRYTSDDSYYYGGGILFRTA